MIELVACHHPTADSSSFRRSPMSTQTSLVTGVDFVVVPTKNLEAACDFYGTVLGLSCSSR